MASSSDCRTQLPKLRLGRLRLESDLGRHAHLRHHRVQAESGEILIYAPDTSPDVYLEHGRLGHVPMFGTRAKVIAELIARMRYSPVMKLVREGTSYAAMRMTYRGKGGWSYPLATGPIATLAKRFVRPIGTDDFFELY